MSPKLAALDRVSLGEFLRTTTAGADTPELVGAFTKLGGWWDKASTMFLRDQKTDTSTGLQEIVGGRRCHDAMRLCALDADDGVSGSFAFRVRTIDT